MLVFVACGGSGGGGDVDAGDEPGDSDAAVCVDGAQRCDGNTLQTCNAGEFGDTEECNLECDDTYGCVVCQPLSGICTEGTASQCRADGSGYDSFACDPAQGMTCTDAGLCVGECTPDALGSSYIGCEYYPTVTGNPVSNAFSFAIVVSNTADEVAQVTVDGGALAAPDLFMVPAQSVVVRTLPWQEALKLCTVNGLGCTSGGHPSGAMVAGGAYRVRSTVPITLYQFNPLEYAIGAANSYTNDASLLLPINVWRGEYYVASWPNTGALLPGLMAVTAHQDDTTVTITTRANTVAENGAPAFTAGTPQSVTLNAGDVLELGTLNGDLTGSHVESDKPVQVIGGHYCANVPDGVSYCDHMEESMFSVDALGDRYVVNAPAVTTIPGGKEQVVRIIATAANTTLTYDPPQLGAPTTIANAGDFVEISRQAASYLITASAKVMVVQLMEGSTAGGNTGDPAMALAVPVEQFREDYLFHAPTNYLTNYVDITAPMGATVTLDGVDITTFTAIGDSGFGLARVTPLDNGPLGDGTHSITGTEPFGITVYGYGDDTSYWYAGGLDLTDIVID